MRCLPSAAESSLLPNAPKSAPGAVPPRRGAGIRRAARAGQGQRLEYCGALRAFLRPSFLRSLTRGSRVRKPAFFSGGRLLLVDPVQRAGDAEAQRAGLAGDAAAVDAGDDVVGAVELEEP